MPDIYVDVGPMAVNKDPKKVAAKYAEKARPLMRDAARKAIRGTAGFTAEKKAPKGFYLDATLAEVTIGADSVTCKITGIVATYPQKMMLTKSLTGNATLTGGSSDADFDDCIKTVIEATTKDKVIPYLKTQPRP